MKVRHGKNRPRLSDASCNFYQISLFTPGWGLEVTRDVDNVRNFSHSRQRCFRISGSHLTHGPKNIQCAISSSLFARFDSHAFFTWHVFIPFSTVQTNAQWTFYMERTREWMCIGSMSRVFSETNFYVSPNCTQNSSLIISHLAS